MEALQRLTRRQLDTLQAVQAAETPERGVSLQAVAARLGVRPPSALDHLTQLEAMTLVTRYRGKTRLTPKGTSLLLEYLRHHRVTESAFSHLGLSPDEACRAAREVDLAVSHRTVDQLCSAGGHPSTCAHGEPIPPCETVRRKR